MSLSPSIARYRRRVLIASAVYGIGLVAAAWLLGGHRVTGPAAFAVTLIPALAVVGIFAAIGRYLVEERDEYLRDRMARQVIVASGFALSVATIWGFLASFDLVTALPAYFVAALWFVGLALGRLVTWQAAR